MSKRHWCLQVFSLEIRKFLSYRVDFWTHFAGAVVVQLIIVYFLWQAIFQQRQVDTIGGYTFHSLMLYYVLTALISPVLRGSDIGFISREIYDGSLNRYLVYPVSFFLYKYSAYSAVSTLNFSKLVLAVLLFIFAFDTPADFPLRYQQIGMGIISIIAANYLYFSISAILEMVAFWADNVWSLLVMLHFVTLFCGGGLIPLSMFPSFAQTLCQYLPFAYLVSFPIETVLGKLDFFTWLQGLGIIVAWSFVFSIIYLQVWKKGTYQYTGVGI